jgi:6-phosphogluconate dehydrogenase
MAQADIGLIGLGVMGSCLALNIAEKGNTIAVFDLSAEKRDKLMKDAGPLAARIIPCADQDALVSAVKPPRPIILLVPAGNAVDSIISGLRPLLEKGDIIIDSGNTNFHDTRRRFDLLKDSGLTFIGMGISGGEQGARHGPSIMVGGTPESYARVKPVLDSISAKYHGEPCSAYCGSDGAGHFVKMIHNGIEYADMQMIAEIYGIMRDGLGLSPADAAAVFKQWNAGRLNSYLIEITADVLAVVDPQTGKPIVDVILDRAGQKGTGQWSTIAAQTLGTPATAIEAAVFARSLSGLKSERVAAEALYGGEQPAMTNSADTLKALELALFAGKINAYAQGFAVLSAASKEYGWALPMATIARIWRAGCIIRSQFLDTIAAAYEETPGIANILVAPYFVAAMKEAAPSLRKVAADAALNGIPVPALGSALSYFESYRHALGTANLIQGQRDFFGAHGFERVDEPGTFHGPWGIKHG